VFARKLLINERWKNGSRAFEAESAGSAIALLVRKYPGYAGEDGRVCDALATVRGNLVRWRSRIPRPFRFQNKPIDVMDEVI
jgi:hypothetical protein